MAAGIPAVAVSITVRAILPSGVTFLPTPPHHLHAGCHKNAADYDVLKQKGQELDMLMCGSGHCPKELRPGSLTITPLLFVFH